MKLAGPASLYTWQLQEAEQLGAAAVCQLPRKRFQQLLHSSRQSLGREGESSSGLQQCASRRANGSSSSYTVIDSL